MSQIEHFKNSETEQFKNAAEYTYKLARIHAEDGTTLGMVIPKVFNDFPIITKDTYWDYVRALLTYKPKDGKIPAALGKDPFAKEDVSPKTLPVASPFLWSSIPGLDTSNARDVIEFINKSPIEFNYSTRAAFSSLWVTNKWCLDKELLDLAYKSDLDYRKINWYSIDASMLTNDAVRVLAPHAIASYENAVAQTFKKNESLKKEEKKSAPTPYGCIQSFLTSLKMTTWPDELKKSIKTPNTSFFFKTMMNIVAKSLAAKAEQELFKKEEKSDFLAAMKTLLLDQGSLNGVFSSIASEPTASDWLIEVQKKNDLPQNLLLEISKSPVAGPKLISSLENDTSLNRNINSFFIKHQGILFQQHLSNNDAAEMFNAYIALLKTIYVQDDALSINERISDTVNMWLTADHEVLTPYMFVDVYLIKDQLLPKDKKKLEAKLGMDLEKLADKIKDDFNISEVILEMMHGNPYQRISVLHNYLNTGVEHSLTLPELHA